MATSIEPTVHAAEEDEKLPFERVIFFSDAVFAIAITVLVLDLIRGYEAAAGGPASHGHVFEKLDELGILLGTHIVGFWVVGTYWMAHHRVFQYFHSAPFGLIALNLLFLMLVALIPFTTFVWGIEDLSRDSTIVYGAHLGCVSLALLAIWIYGNNDPRAVVEAKFRRDWSYYCVRLSATIVAAFLVALLALIGLNTVANVLLIVAWFLSAFVNRRLLSLLPLLKRAVQ